MSTTDALRAYTNSVRLLNAANQRIATLIDTLDNGPSFQEGAAALLEYHRCRQEMDAAWAHIPEGQQHILQPPEHYY